ncbi:metal-dependent transcriptional regulator [Rhodococcus globerulus]|uniref:Manganese transport regulator n=1 Tax=Rhodococcus globerulus TaxID=33008 RepID=A0ABU4C3A0_RHOGO|nr:metal-dependent transcriptional regulator [Rhodococcus globerulus]MDV6270974.1 metal-dependent transcriptional regulator [Rhodococcus globerulus]
MCTSQGAYSTLRTLSPVAQHHLKIIWTTREWSQDRVSAKLLCEKFCVSASTASEVLQKLSDRGLVDCSRRCGITLTDAGRTAAVMMARRHRLIATYLADALGYSWDEVHDEAEVLEHAVSELMLARIDAKLGYPSRDPHGDPIPAADGSIPFLSTRRLSEFGNGEGGRIARVSDSDSRMLRYLADVGLTLDVTVTILERRDVAGTVTIGLGASNDSIELGNPVAQSIWLI